MVEEEAALLRSQKSDSIFSRRCVVTVEELLRLFGGGGNHIGAINTSTFSLDVSQMGAETRRVHHLLRGPGRHHYTLLDMDDDEGFVHLPPCA